MDKKVIVISSSPRKGGNSDMLADKFIEGAIDAGNTAEKIRLTETNISFCKGCMACQKTNKCVIRDDAEVIINKMKEADVVVFATPVYYYSVSGQLKTLFDRTNPLYSQDYAYRSIYLLASATEDEKTTVNGTQAAVQGWVDCFPKAIFKGTVFAGGVTKAGDIQGHKALAEAYELGKSI